MILTDLDATSPTPCTRTANQGRSRQLEKAPRKRQAVSKVNVPSVTSPDSQTRRRTSMTDTAPLQSSPLNSRQCCPFFLLTTTVCSAPARSSSREVDRSVPSGDLPSLNAEHRCEVNRSTDQQLFTPQPKPSLRAMAQSPFRRGTPGLHRHLDKARSLVWCSHSKVASSSTWPLTVLDFVLLISKATPLLSRLGLEYVLQQLQTSTPHQGHRKKRGGGKDMDSDGSSPNTPHSALSRPSASPHRRRTGKRASP